MDFGRDDDLPPLPEEEEALPPAPVEGEVPRDDIVPANGGMEGASVLLLDEPVGGSTLPDEAEPEDATPESRLEEPEPTGADWQIGGAPEETDSPIRDTHGADLLPSREEESDQPRPLAPEAGALIEDESEPLVLDLADEASDEGERAPVALGLAEEAAVADEPDVAPVAPEERPWGRRAPAPSEASSSLLLDEPALVVAEADADEPEVVAESEPRMDGAPPHESRPAPGKVEVPAEEASPLLLDDVLSPTEETPTPTRHPQKAPAPAAFSDFAADAEPSALLLDEGAMLPPEAALVEASPPPSKRSSPSEPPDSSALLIGEPGLPPPAPRSPSPSAATDSPSWEDLGEGQSALLLGTDAAAPKGPGAGPEVRVKRRRRWRKGERIRPVAQKPGKPVEWFSNPQACAVYCRKHRQPLLLYFTTGDVAQCGAYEEAIRLPELQPFLGAYVCCLVNLAQAEGRQTAVRLGVPTDGPALVLLTPSGRELARVQKPDIDWHFLAAMLFWVLR